MHVGKKLEINQEARLENLANLLNFVEDACRQFGIDRAICIDIKLAVEEACVNLINHGYAQGEPGPIRLTFQSDAHQVVINIGDHAPPFPPEQAPPPDLHSEWWERQMGGLGWHLIRQMVDEISYRSDPENGNLLTLIKRLPPKKDNSRKEV